jgi:hypothetical protein
MTEKLISIINKIPDLMDKIDNKTRGALINLRKNKKIIVIQYQHDDNFNTVGTTDDELLVAIQNSIQFYELSLMDFIFVFKDFVPPCEDKRIKCFELTLDEAINKNLILRSEYDKFNEFNKLNKLNEKTHFVAFVNFSDGSKNVVSFFKDIQLNFSQDDLEKMNEILKIFYSK